MNLGNTDILPTLKIKFGDLSLKTCGTLENAFDFLMYGNCSLWSNKRLEKCSLLLSMIICYPDPSVQVLSVPVGNGTCSIHRHSGLFQIMPLQDYQLLF